MLWFDYYWHKVLKRPYTLSRRIDKGRGQPVVFLHGIASNGENWREVADMLDTKHHRIIVFDLLGFGDSPRPDWLEYSVDDHAQAVVASLRRMGIRRPIILVGHSMGGLVASHIAHQYPKKVAHLILYQMPIFSRLPNMKTKDLKRQAYLSVFRYLAEHRKVTLWYAKVLGRSASRLAGFFLDEHTWQPFELSLKNTIMQQQSYENLRSLKMPTDVVYGKYDIFVLKKNLQHYFRPSRYLRFYEIDELHRVSKRSSKLVYELIMQDPKGERTVVSDHARLITMSKTEDLERKPQKQRSSRQTYVRSMGLAGLGVLVTTALAWQGNLPGWEQSLFIWLNGWQAPGFVDILARISSDIVWLAVFMVAFSLLIKKYFWGAYRIAVPAVATFGIVRIAEEIIGRARPDVALPDITVARAIQDGMGFPSGHVATITAILLVLWPYLTRPMRIGAFVLIALVGWSRVYLGVHFPLDIVGSLFYAVLVFSALRIVPKQWRVRTKLDA